MGDELLLVGVDILPVQGGPFGLLLRGQALGTLALFGQFVDPGDLFRFHRFFLLIVARRKVFHSSRRFCG